MTSIWRISLLAILVCAMGSGRAEESEVDTRKSPPDNARWLTLIVQAEDDIAPQPVSLEYQAGQCSELRSYGVGGQSQSGRTRMPAVHFEKIDLSKESSGQRYRVRIALDAGGNCQWKLVGLSTQFKYTSSHAQTGAGVAIAAHPGGLCRSQECGAQAQCADAFSVLSGDLSGR